MANGVLTNNNGLTCMGPLVVPVLLDFREATECEVDLSARVQNNEIDFIASVYVDNIDSEQDIHFICGGTGARITARAGKQSFLPLIQPNYPKLICRVNAPLGYAPKVFFSNIPFAPFIN